MKRRGMRLLLLCFLLLAAGCGKKQETDLLQEMLKQAEQSETEQTPTPAATVTPDAAEDSVVLRWGIIKEGVPSAEAGNALNEALRKRGLRVQISFVPIALLSTMEDIRAYEQENGVFDMVTLLDSNTYSYNLQAIKEGYFYCLDELLKQDAGKSLWEQIDEKRWQAGMVNGSVYSIPNESALCSADCVLFNPDYFTKEEADAFSGSLEELDAMVREKAWEGVSVPIFYFYSGFNFLKFYGYELYYGMALSYEDGRFYSPLDCPETERVQRMIQGWQEDGLLPEGFLLNNNGIGRYTSTYAKVLKEGDFLVCIASQQDKTELPQDFYEWQSSCVQTHRLSGGTAVTAASEYKEEAFELLCLLHSDQELATLLVYGKEGEDYTLQDGTVIVKDAFVPSMIQMATGIYDILPTADKKPKLTLAGIQAFYKAEVMASPFLSLQIDTAPVEAEVVQTMQFLQNNCDLWKQEDLSGALAEARSQAEKAGAGKVLEEFNRQTEAYLDGTTVKGN